MGWLPSRLWRYVGSLYLSVALGSIWPPNLHAANTGAAAETAAPANKGAAEPDTAAAAKAGDAPSSNPIQEYKPDKTEKDKPPRSTVGEQKTALDDVNEAIQVFRQETERIGARAEGGDRKSSKGSSQGSSWHGRVYEYIRNNAFDAVPHEVVQNGGDQNILRRNQFGASISGPVVIPKLYDGRRSTFFTFSYEGTRERVGRSYLRTLPTAQQRGGDFSDLVNRAGLPVTIYDPLSTRLNPAFDPAQPVSMGNLEYEREAFANNQVPPSRLDETAARMNQHYPLPNTAIGPFLQNNYWANPSERNTPDGFIARLDQNVFQRHKITVDVAQSRGFAGQPRIYDTIGNAGRPDRDFLDQRLGVRETFNVSPNAVYEGSFEAATEQIETEGLNSDRNLPQELGLRGVGGAVFPSIRFRNYYGLGAPTGSYFRNVWNSYRTSHSLSLRQGAQNWSFSTRLRRYELNTLEDDAPSGYLQFEDSLTGLPGINNTGDSFASFLLGMAGSGRVTDIPQPSYLRRTAVDNTVRNEIELADNLTATVGVTVSLQTGRVEKFDRMSTLDMNAPNPANGRPGALVFAGRDGYGRSFQPLRTRFQPRLGVTWSPTAKRDTVVRANFQHYYTDISLRTGPFASQGFTARRMPISPNRQLEPAVTLDEGFPELDNPLPDLRPDAANETDIDLVPQTAAQPRFNYLSFSVEQRLPSGLIARAQSSSYRGRDLLVGGSVAGINRIPFEALQHRDLLNSEEFRRELRPFPQFQQVQADNQYPAGRYLHDITRLSLEKRAAGGASFDVSYQYRRRYDDYSGPGIQNPFDRSTAWAVTRGNRPHSVSLSYVYELPFGSGKSLFNQSGILAKVFGDWSISGFTSWQSGDPVVLQPEFNNTGTVVPYLRVNAVPGADPHVANRSPHAWFNPAAFAHPADFSTGDVPRTHPTLRNPSWQNHDLAVSKRVPISSERSLELLFQGFNFVNTANWNDPDSTISPDGAQNVNAGRIIGSRGGRVLQLGMRYNF